MSSNNRDVSLQEVTKLTPSILVILLVFSITAFIGWQEVNRVFPQFELERIATVGKTLKRQVEQFLESGVPLDNFVGFQVMADSVLDTEPSVKEILIRDQEDHLHHFVSSQEISEKPSVLDEAKFSFADLDVTDDGIFVQTSPDSESVEEGTYQVVHYLSNKFERVGTLSLVISKKEIARGIRASFTNVLWMVSFSFLVLGLGLYFSLNHLLRNQRKAFIGFAFTITSLVGSGLVLGGIIHVYYRGLTSKTEAVVETLGQQLKDVQALGVPFSSFSDLPDLLDSYQKLNSEITHISLVSDNTIIAHTQDSQVGMPYRPSVRTDEYRVEFGKSGSAQEDAFLVAGISRNFFSKPARDMLKSKGLLFLTLILVGLVLLQFLDQFIFEGFRSAKAPALLVLSVSFTLLFYVGLGETYRNYPKLQLMKMEVQAEAIKQSMEVFLKSGVPLSQFVGFKTLTDPLMESDTTISQIICKDISGQRLFSNSSPHQERASLRIETISANNRTARERNDANSQADSTKPDYEFSTDSAVYQVTMPISDKFETVGAIIIRKPSIVVSNEINKSFSKLAIWMFCLVALYGLSLIAVRASWIDTHPRYLNISYGIAFILAALLVVNTLIQIYSEGIKDEVRILSTSLGKRLESALQLGLPLKAFSDIDTAFRDYKVVNPSISGVSLIEGEKIAIDEDPSRVGSNWEMQTSSHFEYNSQLDANQTLAAQSNTEQFVSVTIPKKAVYKKLWRTVKNFMALFIATGFLASLFLNLLFSLNEDRKYADVEMTDEIHDALVETKTVMIKILYFLIVFMEGLFSSFLPIYFQKVALESGLNSGASSLLFTAFFAAFAASLIPSGKYADKKGVRKLLLAGVFLNTISIFGMAVFTNFNLLLILRILSGFGQGMVFIGIQSFLLANSPKGKTTKGTSVIVFGYNAGMISGTAIGALLVLYMGALNVFVLASLMGIFSLLYIIYLVPASPHKLQEEKEERTPRRSLGTILRGVLPMFKDFQFLKTMSLIGLTTKMTLTGIIVFALPLVMVKLDYLQDDIGQVLMFYAIGVLISNRIAAKVADRSGKTAKILFIGTLGSGIGLVLMGLSSQAFVTQLSIPFAQTLAIALGVLILGFAHGFIHAPIVTHIAKTDVAEHMGKATVVSTYRFMERFGHVAGPMVVSVFLIKYDYSAFTLSFFGITIILLGTLFFVLGPKTRNTREWTEV